MSGLDTSVRFIITADTRRRWSTEEKRATVEEAAQESRSVSRVARHHGISPSLLFRWRRELSEGKQTLVPGSEPTFILVALPAPAVDCVPQPKRLDATIAQLELLLDDIEEERGESEEQHQASTPDAVEWAKRSAGLCRTICRGKRSCTACGRGLPLPAMRWRDAPAR
jgi:transposase-like protein